MSPPPCLRWLQSASSPPQPPSDLYWWPPPPSPLPLPLHWRAILSCSAPPALLSPHGGPHSSLLLLLIPAERPPVYLCSLSQYRLASSGPTQRPDTGVSPAPWQNMPTSYRTKETNWAGQSRSELHILKGVCVNVSFSFCKNSFSLSQIPLNILPLFARAPNP